LGDAPFNWGGFKDGEHSSASAPLFVPSLMSKQVIETEFFRRLSRWMSGVPNVDAIVTIWCGKALALLLHL